ncbi:uncharacterized protein PRCAT00001740001 [Priceomyces carsonii]|uniref:uncharacterized protein n=1 Tax=Priceomyces carsonii TaxID=28549 RepID=UPI002EDB2D8F|nr:unnamed protein product [Priceomyces carsonii]
MKKSNRTTQNSKERVSSEEQLRKKKHSFSRSFGEGKTKLPTTNSAQLKDRKKPSSGSISGSSKVQNSKGLNEGISAHNIFLEYDKEIKSPHVDLESRHSEDEDSIITLNDT